MSRLLLITFLVGLCLFFLKPAMKAFTATKNDSAVPYGNALDEIRKKDFKEALSWLDTVIKDFPDSDEGSQAQVLRSVIYVSRELACLKIVNLFRESQDLIIGKKRKELKREFEEVVSEYNKRASDSAEKLIPVARDVIALEDKGMLKSLKLNTIVDPEGWDVSDLRDSVRKGKNLEKKAMQKLYNGEMLTAFMGFMAQIVPPPEGNILSGLFNGQVNRVKLYSALGERFLINSKRKDADPDFSVISSACFEKVKNLTRDNIYSKERKRALEVLTEINSSESKSVIKCPSCKRIMKNNWKYCPFDGTKIKK